MGAENITISLATKDSKESRFYDCGPLINWQHETNNNLNIVTIINTDQNGDIQFLFEST